MKRLQLLRLMNAPLALAGIGPLGSSDTPGHLLSEVSMSISVFGRAHVAVLSRSATVLVINEGRKTSTLMNIPRPPFDQQRWQSAKPPAEPPYSGTTQSGEIVCVQAPDEATAVTRAGVSAIFAMATVCGIPYAYLVRVFPDDLRLETYALPLTTYAAKVIYISGRNVVVIFENDETIRLEIDLN